MKKLFIITIALCMAFVLTACSTKDKKEGSNTPTNNTEEKEPTTPVSKVQELDCNKDYSSQMSNGVRMDQDVHMEFLDNKVQVFDMGMNFEIPSSLSSAADSFVNTMMSTYESQYGKYDGVTVSLKKVDDLHFTIIISMDFKNMSAQDKVAIGMSGSEDYTVNKTAFINQGYTCE